MVNNALDFGILLKKCGAGIESPQAVAGKIAETAADLKDDEFTGFIEYILTNNFEPEILTTSIKLSDSRRNTKFLPHLLDILLLRNIEGTDADTMINVRVLCAKAIANYKDTSTVNALLYCLNNKTENYKIRLACADALGRIGDRFAVEPLIDVVKDEEEKSVYVKESAAFALGLIGDTNAIDPLVAIMEAKQGLLGKFSFLKEKIVEALGKLNLNNAKVLKVLKNALLDSSPMVRINAVEALMNSEYEEAPELIRTALHDEDDEVKRNALIALYNLTGRDILDEVISLPGYDEFLKSEAKSLIEEYEEENS